MSSQTLVVDIIASLDGVVMPSVRPVETRSGQVRVSRRPETNCTGCGDMVDQLELFSIKRCLECYAKSLTWNRQTL